MNPRDADHTDLKLPPDGASYNDDCVGITFA